MLNLDIRELFDPIQTHAAYGVPTEQVTIVKQTLKAKGATRFRVVKSGIVGQVIVCFKMPPKNKNG